MFEHSVRTYLHGVIAARRLDLSAGRDFDPEPLFYAAVLHDIGTADAYDGPVRFEVEGADAAARLLTEAGLPAAAVDQVWEAIALHTSPQIAERRGPITVLTRAGVVADFSPAPASDRDRYAAIEAEHPRQQIERHLKRLVLEQVLRQPGKAPRSSWPGLLLLSHTGEPVPPDTF